MGRKCPSLFTIQGTYSLEVHRCHRWLFLYHIVFEKPPWGKIIKDVCMYVCTTSNREGIENEKLMITQYKNKMMKSHAGLEVNLSELFVSMTH